MDLVLSLRQLQEISRDNDKHIFNTFDDITKVSDTVLRMLFGSSFGTWVFLKGYLL